MTRHGHLSHPRGKENEFRRLRARYGGRKGALIPLLQKTQALFGHLSERAMVRIARALRISPAEVYGVATFYGQFRLKPVGKNLITVCHGTACHVAGAERISEALEIALGVKSGDTTEDGLFTVHDVACLGCCSLSPVMMVNATVYGKLTSARIPSILKKHS